MGNLPRRWTRYAQPENTFHISNSDDSLYQRAMADALTHVSGGSYNMAAWLSNSKPIGYGLNQLSSPALLKSDLYPEVCGLHAELSLWSNYKEFLSGGTVAIGGWVAKSSNPMSNTLPCTYCATILHQAGVRWVIASLNAEQIKVRPEMLCI